MHRPEVVRRLGPRAEAKAATRAHILDHARRFFAECGYEAVTIRDLAARMKRSTGAVFAHFAGKAELFKAATGRDAPEVRLRELLAELSSHPELAEAADALRRDLYGPPR